MKLITIIILSWVLVIAVGLAIRGCCKLPEDTETKHERAVFGMGDE